MVYFLGVLLSIINDKRLVTLKIFTLVLLIFVLFRYGIGADYFSYKYLFSRLNNPLNEMMHGIDNQEIGFRLITSVIKYIGIDYQVSIMIFGAVNIGFIYLIAKKYSLNPTLSMLVYSSLYYFAWSFNAIRQGAIIGIGVFILLKYIESNYLKRYLSILLILPLFHTSSLILLVFAVIIKLIKRFDFYVYLSMFAVISSFFAGNLFIKVFAEFPLFYKILPYIDENINLFDLKSLFRIVVLLSVLLSYRILVFQNLISENVMKILILSNVTYFLLQNSELTAARLSVYGNLLLIIYLVSLIYSSKRIASRSIISYLILILLFLYFTKEINAMNSQSGLIYQGNIYNSYSNVFNKDNFIYTNRYIQPNE